MSSLTNFMVLIVAAGAVGRASFGAFAVALAVAATVVGVARAVGGEPLAVRHATTPVEDRPQVVRGALGAALLVGIAGAVVVAVGGVAAGGAVGDALLPLAIVLPGLVLQDAYRFALVAAAQPAKALVSDTAWLVVQAAALLALAPFGQHDVATLVLVWGATANLGMIVAATQCRVLPDLLMTRRWLRAQRDLWPRFTGELLALTGSWQLALLGLGVVAGLDSVGALRGAQVLLGPLNVAFLAVPLVMVPESSRWWKRGHGDPPRHAAWIAGALALLALAWGTVVLALPVGVGRSLLGASWVAARDLVVPVTLVMAGVGLTLGALTGLRVLGAARESLRARVVTASAVVVAIVTGGMLAGSVGAGWGWAIAATTGAWVWWHALNRAWRRVAATVVEPDLAVA